MIPAMAIYPEDSIQPYYSSERLSWWQRKDPGDISEPERWDLLVSFVPFLGDVPRRADFTRSDPKKHDWLEGSVNLFHIDKHKVRDDKELPAAAFPDGAFIYPGKVRPVIVVSRPHPWPNRTIRGTAQAVTKPVFAVAPFYGTEPDGTRGGFPEEFVTRIRRAGYAQFFWDQLPSGLPHISRKDCSSILRLDQIFPINRSRDSEVAGWAPTGYKLSEKARDIMEEWLQWHHTGGIKEKGIIAEYRSLFLKPDNATPA